MSLADTDRSIAKIDAARAKRAPAHSIEAEQHTLGGLLIDCEAFCRVSSILDASDFFRADHRLIFSTIAQLARAEKPFDAFLVSEELARGGSVDVGIAYLASLARDTATSAHVEAYAKIVREKALLRDVQNLIAGTERAIADGSPVSEIVANAVGGLARLNPIPQQAPAIEPLVVEPVSAWAERNAPPLRDWICEGASIGAGRVSLLAGNGGFGKTTIAAQLAVACATSSPLFGLPVNGGPVFGLFCEDEQDEVERRGRVTCQAEGIDLALLDNLYLHSRDGHDNILCAFERDQIVLTPFYWQLDATFARIKPRLAIIDGAADVFAGDFISTPHVRQFIKVALGGLCLRHGTAVCLLAHPSASAMASGDGGGFSVAWHNSVRSRLYLRRPKSEDADAIADRRVLEIKKSNYGPTGTAIPLIYERGRFVVDPDPIEECSRPIAAKSTTRLSLAVMAYFTANAAAGQVVAFGALFESLQGSGEIARGEYQVVRKPLQRTLKNLVDEGLLKASDVPRGYRMAQGHPS